jgi:hypothetical protein
VVGFDAGLRDRNLLWLAFSRVRGHWLDIAYGPEQIEAAHEIGSAEQNLVLLNKRNRLWLLLHVFAALMTGMIAYWIVADHYDTAFTNFGVQPVLDFLYGRP